MAVAAVLLVVIAAGAYKELARTPRSTTPVPGSMVNLPETTVNLADGHLLQVSVALQLVQGEELSNQKIDVLENNEIDVLSSFRYSTLLGTAGKTDAETALLRHFNLAIAKEPGSGGTSLPTNTKSGSYSATHLRYVLAVYFTYFVMQ